MLALCLADGLTCDGKVFRSGEVFKLSPAMEGEFGGLTPSQMVSKQRQMYRRELFRLPTPDEILGSYQLGKITIEMCDSREYHIIGRAVSDKGIKAIEAGKAMMEKAERVDPTLVEEDEAEPVATVAPATQETEEEIIADQEEEVVERTPPVVESSVAKKGTTTRRGSKRG